MEIDLENMKFLIKWGFVLSLDWSFFFFSLFCNLWIYESVAQSNVWVLKKKKNLQKEITKMPFLHRLYDIFLES